MRVFYDFALDSRSNHRECVCGYELGEFRSSIFARGERFQGSFPPDVKLWVHPGEPTDALGEPLSWPILSENLIAIVRQYAGADIQEVSVPLFYVDSKKAVTRYKLANVLKSLEAIDMQMSVTSDMTILGKKIINVIEAVYRNDAVPPDVHIFRPKESPYRIVISEELAQAMRGDMVGVALIKTKTI